MSMSAAVQDAAIGWLVELSSGEADEGQHHAFTRWLAADARHAAAWHTLGQAVEHSVGPLQAAGGAGTVGQTLVGAAFGGAWLLRGSPFLPDWSADLHTATARRGRYTLADGSVLTLDARSSADMHVTHEYRHLTLLQGMLVAIDQPLGDIVAALRPYRHGYIDITAQAAALRASGNYSLDDSGATFLALAETLPVTLRQGPGGWWTGLDLNPLYWPPNIAVILRKSPWT